ncbi:MAG: sigma-54-dependent Fis family transcriptional regulator [Deltaproteobacteria bacterium]|nr:sigma-54-dependent Fis family transcriptional regulator [Deltaproteobacteria bacterium]
MHHKILIIEDDGVMQQTLTEVFQKSGFLSYAGASAGEGLRLFQTKKVDLVLMDLRLPDRSGLEVLQDIRSQDNLTPVIMMTANPDAKTAVKAMKLGAFDYIIKPFELDELKLIVGRALEATHMKDDIQRLRRLTQPFFQPDQGLGISSKAKELESNIRDVGTVSKTTVLITGESGTGKELVVDAIHFVSDRAKNPLLKINCSAIPAHLLETEFFGAEKGAFTDSKETRKGLLELADGGSLLLDEIAEMPLPLQAKILRVLEYQTFKRIGGVKDIDVNVRIMASTNRDLTALVRDGQFREDLYYRLKVFQIGVPPLRDRREDIPWLTEKFLRHFGAQFRRELRIDEGAKELLAGYPWPGNIRELRNVIERACILAANGVILPSHLPVDLRAANPQDPAGDFSARRDELSLEEVEKRHILTVLEKTGGNKSEAARILGIARITLREKLKKYGIGSDPEEIT